METKKLKKLVLKKETIVNLSNFEQNGLRGGDTGDWICAINQYLTYTLSHYDPANCINGYAGTDNNSYCRCDQETDDCPTKKGFTCQDGYISCNWCGDYFA